MTSALKWALGTSAITIGVAVVGLGHDPREGPLWVRSVLLVALLGAPVAGGVVAAMKGVSDRRAGRSAGQTLVALALAIALVTLGAGLLLAMTSVTK